MKKYQVFLKYTDTSIKLAADLLIAQSCGLLLIDKGQVKVEKYSSADYSVFLNTGNSSFITDITGDLRVYEIITLPE